MDIGVLGIVVTALVGLAGIGATHFYHVCASREQKAIVDRLPDDLAAVLKEDAREKLTIPELNELIFRKSINEDALNESDPKRRDPLPYKACPSCGNTDLTRGISELRRGHVYYIIGCERCGWSEATE